MIFAFLSNVIDFLADWSFLFLAEMIAGDPGFSLSTMLIFATLAIIVVGVSYFLVDLTIIRNFLSSLIELSLLSILGLCLLS